MSMKKTLHIAASGMGAQSVRVRVIAENIANANSLGTAPGDEPYRRKTVSFASELDCATGAELVSIDRIGVDRSEFGSRHDPNHPAADENGYVQTPNVNSLLEMMDLREAQRSYDANLKVIETAKNMVSRTLELLR